MEEDYGNRLQAAEAGRLQSLEELKQAYEARLEETSQQLTEVDQEEREGLHLNPSAGSIRDLVPVIVFSVGRNPNGTAAGSSRW